MDEEGDMSKWIVRLAPIAVPFIWRRLRGSRSG
jgi:hypothetical protein